MHKTKKCSRYNILLQNNNILFPVLLPVHPYIGVSSSQPGSPVHEFLTGQKFIQETGHGSFFMRFQFDLTIDHFFDQIADTGILSRFDLFKKVCNKPVCFLCIPSQPCPDTHKCQITVDLFLLFSVFFLSVKLPCLLFCQSTGRHFLSLRTL